MQTSEVFGVRVPNTLLGNVTCVPASMTSPQRILVRVKWRGSRFSSDESSTLQFIQRLDNLIGIQTPALVVFLVGDADGSSLINHQVSVALFPNILFFSQQFIAAHSNRFSDRQNDPSFVPINLIGKTDHFSVRLIVFRCKMKLLNDPSFAYYMLENSRLKRNSRMKYHAAVSGVRILSGSYLD